MLTLTSGDSFLVDGKLAYAIAGVKDLNPRTLIGQMVTLDDRIVKIARVETHAVMDPTGQAFSVIPESEK